MQTNKPLETVLIVDDDLAIRMLMKQALSDQNLQLIEAESGEQAIELFKQYSPELTLLDVNMGGMDGFECCEKLRGLPDMKHLAIVMVTGLERPEDVDKAFNLGATDFMTKPLTWPLFKHRVRYILKASQTVRDLSINQSTLTRAQSIAGLGSWTWDFKAGQGSCSVEVCRMIGIPTQPFINFREAISFIHPEDRDVYRRAVGAALREKEGYTIEYRFFYNGKTVNVEERVQVSQENGHWHLFGILHDITERKNSEEKITYYAYYDTLTKLPNRRRFIEQLQQAILTAKRRQEELALLFIDLDHFKQVNDTFGHHAGDQLLCQVADKIKECVRVSDVVGLDNDTTYQDVNHVSRLAGDEFTVLLTEFDDVDNVAAIAQRLIDALREPFYILGNQIKVSISIGIAFYPDDAVDRELLLQHADAAMYHAKKLGRDNYQFFSKEINAALKDKITLEFDLKQALETNDQFVLHYQPKINIHTQEVTGFEALIRWQHPTRGLLSPYFFIELAETSGLIVELGQWVLVEACRQAKKWQQSFGKPYQIAVNLSAKQFNKKHLPEQIVQALKETNLNPELLEIEITETAIINNIEETVLLLSELKKLGVKLSIDDFGTGHSSLSYLKKFPVDTLKIDKSFVDDIVVNEKDAAIVHTIIQLAANLGLSTVAEGVEYAGQQSMLQKMGCEQMQGYLFSKPLEAKQIEETLF